MPIQSCSLPDGSRGFRYGKSGKCYKSREAALRQMRAIKFSESQGELTEAYVKLKQLSGKWRLIDANTGKIAMRGKTPVDGGGFDSREEAVKKLEAINISEKRKAGGKIPKKK